MKLLALVAATALVLAPAADKVTIKDVTEGKGAGAKIGDLLTVHYTGKLTDGKQFDSSVGREPFRFMLGAGQVIQGWDQGLVGMKEGGKRELTIPASLGYGDAGAGDVIPANATLNFTVELVKIEAPKVKVDKPGKGEGVKFGDIVEVHYTGKFTDGKKFDSSRDRGEAFLVEVGKTRLIPGFTQGLLGMKLGETRTVTIPPSLGYGSVARGPIPADSTLVFELEMMKITPKKESK